MKLKYILPLIVVVLFSCGKNPEANGIEITEIREMDEGFNAVSSAGAYDIQIIDAPADGKIKLVGDEEILKKIEVDIKDGTLKISQKSGFYKIRSSAVKISFSAQHLRSILLTGSGNIEVEGVQRTDFIKIVLDGAGDISVPVDTENTEIRLNGSGNIQISGKTNRLHAGIAGSGDIRAFELTASAVNAGLTGSGNLQVHAVNKLDAGVTGSGELRYKGKPAETEFKTVGSGNIIAVD
ncbi:MAG: DUF2807 domain-containing protein [Weeksellaceae bacterium]|nr:DUF2807 domain-containing protein [Weeksellaceae bacterium]